MRLLAALLLLLALPLWAGVDINNSAQILNGNSIPGHFPMTVGGWINLYAVATDGDGLLTSGDFGGGVGSGWMLHATDTYNGCSGQITFIKGGSTGGGATDAVLCSGKTLPLNVWTFVAAVVTSTQVHFVTITASGTLTSANVSDTNAFTTENSPGTGVGSSAHISTPVFLAHGTVANVFVYGTVALSDAQLQSLARFGPRGVTGPPVTRFWPLYSIASTTVPKTFGEYSGNNNETSTSTTTNLTLLTGTALNANHCPCADPWNYHH